jgi:hypothetical protein
MKINLKYEAIYACRYVFCKYIYVHPHASVQWANVVEIENNEDGKSSCDRQWDEDGYNKKLLH